MGDAWARLLQKRLLDPSVEKKDSELQILGLLALGALADTSDSKIEWHIKALKQSESDSSPFGMIALYSLINDYSAAKNESAYLSARSQFLTKWAADQDFEIYRKVKGSQRAP